MSDRRDLCVRGAGQELLVVQPRIQAAMGQQLVVAAALDDVAALVDEDQVGAQDRRQPVRDGHRGAALLVALDGGWMSRSLTVSRALVASSRIEDARVLEQHAGERDALLLATRQLVAALAHDRVVAVGQLA